MRFLMACALVGLCGCVGGGEQGPKGEQGPRGFTGAPGAPASVEGSRLATRWEAGEDGSARIIGWRDKDLDVDCTFARAADGITRCLPVDISDRFNAFEVAFTDPACVTGPVLVATRLCDPVYGAAPEYVRFKPVDECGGWHVLPVLDPVEAGAVYKLNGDGSCEAIPTPKAVLALGDEVPPSTFVHGGSGVGLTF